MNDFFKTREKIIGLIERNRISSVEIADALNKSGVVSGIKIANPGHFVVGPITYVYAYDGSNNSVHRQIENIKEGQVVFVDAIGCDEKALFGDLVSKYLYLYKRAKAIVVNGCLRDFHRLRKENYPIWFKGTTPLGCVNKQMPLSEETKKYFEKRSEAFENGIIVCDDSGCTVIDFSKINEDMYKKLDFIEAQEDIWYYCIDTLKWSTYDVVCEKKYLTCKSILPRALRERLNKWD